ncbi:hypothetical protein ACFO4O_11585 [Glaciecola siphonariae]|uniref:Uncharacterized protein n=1 Tax=Glaciecola siphonariae TaxID=521012 RepID=A0ABV9LZE4_9ALTE
MNKSETTLSVLQEALQRLISGQPQRVSKTRRISVRAVEEEAGMGDGSAYYYSGFIKKIKNIQVKTKSVKPNSSLDQTLSSVRNKLKKEIQIKERYKLQLEEARLNLSMLATQHNEFMLEILQLKERINELLSDNTTDINSKSPS